jgi:hypothetical protein
MKPSPLAKNLCHCIKKVRKTVKLRPNQKNKSRRAKEQAAIGICVKSVLQTKGKTLRKFKCAKKPYLLTQKLRK